MHRYCVTIGMYNVGSYLICLLLRCIKLLLVLITTHNRHVSDFGIYDLTIDVDETFFCSFRVMIILVMIIRVIIRLNTSPTFQ